MLLMFSYPAVGSALLHACCWLCSFLPAVGPLISTRCRSALLVSFHQDHPSVHVFTQVFWCTRSPASLFCECVSLAPRAPYTPSFAVWCLGLSRACVVSTNCSPVHVLTHVFAARGPVSPRTTRSPPLHTLCVYRALSPELGCLTLRHGRELRHALSAATLVRRWETPRWWSLCLEGLHTAPNGGTAASRAWRSLFPHCFTSLTSPRSSHGEFLQSPHRPVNAIVKSWALVILFRWPTLSTDVSVLRLFRSERHCVWGSFHRFVLPWSGFPLLRPPVSALPPKLSRCDSSQLSPLRLAVCLVVSGHSSTQTCSN